MRRRCGSSSNSPSSFQRCSAGGYRLGYGGGFYDRTLAALEPRPFTVGLGFANGLVGDFEPEAHDVPLDAILNDDGVVWPRG